MLGAHIVWVSVSEAGSLGLYFMVALHPSRDKARSVSQLVLPIPRQPLTQQHDGNASTFAPGIPWSLTDAKGGTA